MIYHSHKRIVLYFAIILLIFFQTNGKSQNMAGENEAKKWAEETLANLTLEKKIGQMICSDITGGYITNDDPRLKRWQQLAGKYGIGAFALYG